MKIAFLTAGGIAPCLSASIGGLIHAYNRIAPEAELIGYLNGYQGLLLGRSYTFPQSVRDNHEVLYRFGGSPIGNSRVKLTNVENCIKRGLIAEGQDPLKVAADQLTKDKIDILHTIGGDDTNTTAADLSNYLHEHGYDLTVVGLPKTIDNDVYPISQTLGAWTAADEGATFFHNIANENTTSTRQLIVHEIMGRHCGWLTARTALEYREGLHEYDWLPDAMLHHTSWDVDAVWVPELEVDLDAEAERLKKKMDAHDGVNIFISEGAGVETIVNQIEKNSGAEVPRDAFGHVRLDEINVGSWFGKQLEGKIGAEKTLVQKSGYFARSAAPNSHDLDLIKLSAETAASAALDGISGVAGLDEEKDGRMRIIEFPRIKGGKPFNFEQAWFKEMLEEIGQPMGKPTGGASH